VRIQKTQKISAAAITYLQFQTEVSFLACHYASVSPCNVHA